MNAPQSSPKHFARDVRHLLLRSHKPRVHVQQSHISGANDGVFATRDLESHTPICLYPGIFTPGLPSFAITEDSTVTYLANDLPPSKVPASENAYILNLSQVGGYLDGLALSRSSSPSTSDEKENGKQNYCHYNRRMDENPSACGHKINHSARHCNSYVVPFHWSNVDPEWDRHRSTNDGAPEMFALPNEIRQDGSPWFFDTQVVWKFNGDKRFRQLLCGAAICTSKQLTQGSEVLLNYNLKAPLPAWGKDWYEVQ